MSSLTCFLEPGLSTQASCGPSGQSNTCALLTLDYLHADSRDPFSSSLHLWIPRIHDSTASDLCNTVAATFKRFILMRLMFVPFAIAHFKAMSCTLQLLHGSTQGKRTGCMQFGFINLDGLSTGQQGSDGGCRNTSQASSLWARGRPGSSSLCWTQHAQMEGDETRSLWTLWSASPAPSMPAVTSMPRKSTEPFRHVPASDSLHAAHPKLY